MKFSTFAVASLAAVAASHAPSAEGLFIKAFDADSFEACAAEAEVIGGELAKIMFADGDDQHRALRSSSQGGHRVLPSCPPSNWCRRRCAGFYPGTCKYAYPWCDPCRRNLQEEDSHEESSSSSSSNSSHDEGTHGEVVLKEVHTLECAKAQLDVHEKILELAEHTLSIDCVDALLASKESKCFSISP